MLEIFRASIKRSMINCFLLLLHVIEPHCRQMNTFSGKVTLPFSSFVPRSDGAVGRCNGAGQNFQFRGVLLIWLIVGQGPTVLAVGVGGGCLDIFLISYISLFFLPLSGRRPDY